MTSPMALRVWQGMTFVLFFGAWELAVRLMHVKAVILPPPSAIFESIRINHVMLLQNSWPTFLAISLGFVWALVAGFIIAIGIAFSRPVREISYPFLVVAQILPKIAFAPLFLIWFGFGLTPKIVIAALIAFFPIVINTAKGLTSVDPELLQYMDSLGASAKEKFFRISLPWAMPYIFAALKISMTLAIVGAVVGEFVAAGEGLGYVINSANISLDTTLMFAGITVLSLLGIVMFLAVVAAERYFTRGTSFAVDTGGGTA